jgi:hypothetical protein
MNQICPAQLSVTGMPIRSLISEALCFAEGGAPVKMLLTPPLSAETAISNRQAFCLPSILLTSPAFILYGYVGHVRIRTKKKPAG